MTSPTPDDVAREPLDLDAAVEKRPPTFNEKIAKLRKYGFHIAADALQQEKEFWYGER